MIGCPFITYHLCLKLFEELSRHLTQAKSLFDQTSMAGCFMLKPDSVPWHGRWWVQQKGWWDIWGCFLKWWENPPNHPFLIGVSIIYHPFWDTIRFGNTHICGYTFFFGDGCNCMMIYSWFFWIWLNLELENASLGKVVSIQTVMHYCIRCHLNSMQYRWTCPEVYNYPILGGLEFGKWRNCRSCPTVNEPLGSSSTLWIGSWWKNWRGAAVSDTAWVLTLCFDVFCMFKSSFILMFIIYKHVFADFTDLCFSLILILLQFLWPFTLTPGLVDTASLTLASRERIPSLQRCWLRVLVKIFRLGGNMVGLVLPPNGGIGNMVGLVIPSKMLILKTMFFWWTMGTVGGEALEQRSTPSIFLVGLHFSCCQRLSIFFSCASISIFVYRVPKIHHFSTWGLAYWVPLSMGR